MEQNLFQQIVEDPINSNGILDKDYGMCLKNQSSCSAFDDQK